MNVDIFLLITIFCYVVYYLIVINGLGFNRFYAKHIKKVSEMFLV